MNALQLFRPAQQQEAFVREFARADETGKRELAIEGDNRSGKTVIAAACFAAMALDQPITLESGEELHMRIPQWRGKALNLMCIGYDWRHVTNGLNRVFFEPNLFRVIVDRQSETMRIWNPQTDNLDRTGASAPLIDQSQIAQMYWENKREKSVSKCLLKSDGTTLSFYPSTTYVRTWGAHAIWCDEKMTSQVNHEELLVSLVDHRGFLVTTKYRHPCKVNFEFNSGDNPYVRRPV